MVYLPNGTGKWKSWSQYTNKLALEIKSLQDYLNYFNPDYYIVNDELKGSEGKTSRDFILEEDKSIINTVTIDGKDYNVVSPQFLTYRQGYYNEKGNNVWIDFSGKVARKEEGLSISDLVQFPPSSTIFSARWTHNGEEKYSNPERNSINVYRILSRTEPAFYVIEGAQNSLVARLYKNGLSTIGSSIFFCIDNFPTRYFLQDLSDAGWGDSGKEGIRWSCEAAYWDNEGSAPTLKIADKQGKVWLNSYPLMHKLHIVDENNVHETFITDDVWQVEKTNIANHTTTRYTIKVENLENESANFAGLKVKTLII